MNFKKLLFILFALSFSTCKVAVKQESNNETKKGNLDAVSVKKMLNDGFKKAYLIVDKTKELPCRYLIQVENGSLLEVINMKEEFKTNNTLIWVKYYPQRRMSTCNNAMPVKITAIKKRM